MQIIKIIIQQPQKAQLQHRDCATRYVIYIFIHRIGRNIQIIKFMLCFTSYRSYKGFKQQK